MPRVTKRYIMDFVNAEFKRLGMDKITCVDVVRTRFRGQDYEAGATCLYIRISFKQAIVTRRKSEYIQWDTQFYSIYFMKGFQKEIDEGRKLKIDFKISGWHIEWDNTWLTTTLK